MLTDEVAFRTITRLPLESKQNVCLISPMPRIFYSLPKYYLDIYMAKINVRKKLIENKFAPIKT